MARTSSLKEYLTDVAGAIKEKKGDLDTPIPANTFDEEIRNLPSGGDIDEYFASYPSFKNIGSGGSNVICKAIKKLPDMVIDHYTMNDLFYNCQNLENIPKITYTYDGTNGLYLESCFNSCYKIPSANELLEKIQGKNVTFISSCFSSCKNIEDLSLVSGLDTSLVRDFSSIFYTCEKLKEIPLFDTSSATSMSNAFGNCLIITTIPSFQTSKCSNFYRTFRGSVSLIEIPKLNFSSATSINYLVEGCTSLTTLGGFESLGFSYTSKTDNYSNYTLDLSTCPLLTRESIINVFENLHDLNKSYADEPHTQQIKLHADVMALLQPEDLKIATDKKNLFGFTA